MAAKNTLFVCFAGRRGRRDSVLPRKPAQSVAEATWKIWCESVGPFSIDERTDRQTHKHTDNFTNIYLKTSRSTRASPANLFVAFTFIMQASRVIELQLYSLHSKPDLKIRAVFAEVFEKALLHPVN